jgi:hypothetical protein
MTHQIDTNDLEYAERLHGKLVGWIPGAINQETGKINPHVTQGVREDGKFVSVFHIKPVYYETSTGHWRPLSEVTLHHGNHSIILNENWWKVHPRYLNWLDKRCKLIGGQLLMLSSFKSYPTPYTGIVRSIHESFIPLKLGLTTSTFYPDPNTETTTVDGQTWQYTPASNFTSLRAAAGNNASDSAENGSVARYFRNMEEILRSFFLFDTSSINDTDEIDSATISFYATEKYNGHSPAQSISCVNTNPASNTQLVAGDYDSLVTATKQASDKTVSGISTSTWVDWSLNSTGLSNINKTGVSKFGFRMAGDVDNSGPSSASPDFTLIHADMADKSGTSTDPKLVVVHSGTSSGPANLKSYNTNLKANIKSINTNPIANIKSLNTNV